SPMNVVSSSLRAKLTVSFAAVALAFLIAVAVGFTKLNTVGTDVQHGYSKAVIANEASANAYNMRVSQAQDALEHKFITNPDGSIMRVGDIAAFQDSLTQLKGLATTKADKTMIAKVATLFAAWKQADTKGIALWQKHEDAASTKWEDGVANDRGDALSNELAAYVTVAQNEAKAAKSADVRSAQVLMGIFSLLALLAAAAIVYFITKG